MFLCLVMLRVHSSVSTSPGLSAFMSQMLPSPLRPGPSILIKIGLYSLRAYVAFDCRPYVKSISSFRGFSICPPEYELAGVDPPPRWFWRMTSLLSSWSCRDLLGWEDSLLSFSSSSLKSNVTLINVWKPSHKTIYHKRLTLIFWMLKVWVIFISSFDLPDFFFRFSVVKL